MLFVQAAGLVAHIGQFVGESIRRLLAKLLSQIVQLAAGAGALGKGLRESSPFECLGRLAQPVATLLHLLALFGHPVTVLLPLHPFTQLVGIAEDLLFLLAKPLELAFDLLARLLSLGCFECGLQLLQAFVQVGLPLCQLAEAGEHLPRLPLGLFLLRLLGTG